MKVLIVGDPNSPFIRHYASALRDHCPEAPLLHLLPVHPVAAKYENEAFHRIFNPLFLRIFPDRTRIMYLFRILYLAWFFLVYRNKFSVLHIHYAIQDLMFLAGLLRRFSPVRIVSVWGSDFLMISGWKRRRLVKALTGTTGITFANPQVMEKFRAVSDAGKIRLHICRYGLNPLEELKRIQHQPDEFSRSQLGLPLSPVIVTVGYNYDPIQQHPEVIRSITATAGLEKYRDNLLFVFPFTYGTDNRHKEEVKSNLESFRYPCHIVEGYLTTGMLAHLRKSSDIMIQVQVSDQLSGSMQEYLFAGNVVITGDWLPYDTFTEHGIYMQRISNPADTGEALLRCLDHLEEEKAKCSGNPEKIYNMSSWNAVMPSWLNLYTNP